MRSYLAAFVTVAVFVCLFGFVGSVYGQIVVNCADIPVATFFSLPVGDRSAHVRLDLRWGRRPGTAKGSPETQLFPGVYVESDGTRHDDGWFVYTDFNTTRIYTGGCYDIIPPICEDYHPGEDWNGNGGSNTDLGQPVFAAGAGRVIFARRNPGFGRTVIIVHRLPSSRYVLSFYGHLNEISVFEGALVSWTTQIGTLGHDETDPLGAHLHFEIRLESFLNPIKDKNDTVVAYSLKDSWPYTSHTWPGKDTTFIANNYADPSSFIRVNNLVGVHEGWGHSESAYAFLLAFRSRTGQDGHNRLGVPDPASPFVREIGPGIFGQAYLQHDGTRPRFGNGHTYLVYNPQTHRAYLLFGGFLLQYLVYGGPAVYGAPINEARPWVTDKNWTTVSSGVYLRQDFRHGISMLWSVATGTFPVASDSIGESIRAAFLDEGSAGTQSTPFLISGWPTSSTQVSLHCQGGLGIGANGHYAWYRDNVEVIQTALPEFTETSLTPGATYLYRVEAVDDVWGAVDVSNDLTLTMPQADVFVVRVTLKQANAVSISVVNQRFAVVWIYKLYRDNVEIAKLSGEAYGDFDLDYSRTYTYQVVAMTASHMELGLIRAMTLSHSPPPRRDRRECDNNLCTLKVRKY